MKNNTREGQSVVALLVFMIMAMTIATTSVAIVINNAINAERLEEGFVAKEAADSGIENALLLLLRNRAYTGGTIAIGTGTTVITVTGTNPQTIRSVATIGNFVRKVEAQVSYTNNVLTVVSWKEVYN
jgi:hypothetical protein